MATGEPNFVALKLQFLRRQTRVLSQDLQLSPRRLKEVAEAGDLPVAVIRDVLREGERSVRLVIER